MRETLPAQRNPWRAAGACSRSALTVCREGQIAALANDRRRPENTHLFADALTRAGLRVGSLECRGLRAIPVRAAAWRPLAVRRPGTDRGPVVPRMDEAGRVGCPHCAVGRNRRLQARGSVRGSCGLKSAFRFMERGSGGFLRGASWGSGAVACCPGGVDAFAGARTENARSPSAPSTTCLNAPPWSASCPLTATAVIL